MTLHPKEQMQALFAARKREETDEFKEISRHRAGIEGTHSEGEYARWVCDGRALSVCAKRIWAMWLSLPL